MDIRNIPHGDMPGDSVQIGEEHIRKAEIIFPELLREMETLGKEKTVICVCGGSGVGKSEIASLLGAMLRERGCGTYVLSGDNYPRRIPKKNDAERLRVYETEGEEGLRAYLGSPKEIDFDEVQGIIDAFHAGKSPIRLKRMGREENELWYDEVDFSETQALIIEWTHGNSDYLHGVDLPIFLYSTPEETLAHRLARHRDGGADSPFTTMVLGMEQDMLHHQARKARIIVTKPGEIISYEEYTRRAGK